MNNKFTDFIKKSEIAAISKIIVFFLAIIIVCLIPFRLTIIIALLLFILIMIISTNKERNKKVKYRLGMDIDTNIYIPLVLDNDYLIKMTNEFNKKVELPSTIKNLTSLVQYMIDNNQMIFVKKNFKLDDIVNSLNDLIQHQNIYYVIDKNDIIKNDDEIISLRRKDNVINDFHDLAMIRSILESNQLELIAFLPVNGEFSKIARIDGYVLGVVPISNVDCLKKYQAELASKLNYR